MHIRKTNGLVRKTALLLIAAMSIAAGDTGFAEAAGREQDGGIAGLSGNRVEVAKSGSYALAVDPENGEIAVSNSVTGEAYLSNPVDRDGDTVRGVKKMQMFSQLYISVYDRKNEEERQLISYTGSVQQDGFTVKGLRNGARLYFAFPEVKITVPLEIRLENNVLKAGVRIRDIQQKGSFVVTQISLLPFFGSGGVKDEGYLVLPDGSGALATFNNGKENYAGYSQTVYGEDAAFSKRLTSGAVQQTAMLPVFGVKKNGGAFLSVISKGDTSAEINAYTAGMQNNQNAVYASFRVYASDLVVIGGDTGGSSKDVKKFSLYKPLLSECEVEYHFLAPDKADYSGMANAYAEYLGAKHKKALRTAADYSMHTSFHGGFIKKSAFLGIPVTRFEKLTSFSEAASVVEKLSGKGAESIEVSVTEWNANQVRGKNANNVAVPSSLGGKKALNGLTRRLGESGARLYLSYEPMLLSRGGGGFSTVKDSAVGVSGEKIQVYTHRPSTYFQDTNYRPFFVVRVSALLDHSARFMQSLSKSKTDAGVFSSQLGTFLSGSYSKKNPYTREDMKLAAEQIFKKSGVSWSFSRANAYALPYADYVTEIPLESSGFDMADRSIPFYQMVASRMCRYYAPALNDHPSEKGTAVMKLLETGSLAAYDWIYEKSSLTKETPVNGLYSSHYGDWIEDAADVYKTLQSAYEKAGSNILTGHRALSPGVYESTFEGGGRMIFNYSDRDYAADGGTVGPGDYAVQRKGGAPFEK